MITLTDPRPTSRPDLSVTVARPAVSMADLGSWAILAFSTTSFMLGLNNANLVDANGLGLMIPMAFAFGGVIQVVVAVLEVIRGNRSGRWSSGRSVRSGSSTR